MRKIIRNRLREIIREEYSDISPYILGGHSVYKDRIIKRKKKGNWTETISRPWHISRIKEVERVYRIIGKGTEEWAEYLNPLLFFVFSIFLGGLFLIPLTLKAYPKVKLPTGYEQVEPTMFRPEHKSKPQNLDNKINIKNTIKSKVKGDSLVKEWERVYDDLAPGVSDGLEYDELKDNIIFGSYDGDSLSLVSIINPINGDTVQTPIARARTPPGNNHLIQVLVGPNNERIIVGMDWNDAENRNIIWVITYSPDGDSLNAFRGDTLSGSNLFLKQQPAVSLPNGFKFVSCISNWYNGYYNARDLVIDTTGDLIWADSGFDTSVEKSSGVFKKILVNNKKIFELGCFYDKDNEEYDSKIFVRDASDTNFAVVNKKYYDFGYDDVLKSATFTPDGKLFATGYYNYYYGPAHAFIVEFDPQTLDTLKYWEFGNPNSYVEPLDMATTSSYLFLAGYINTDSDTTDTAVVWMVDTAGNFIAEYDRPKAIYTGATNIGDSLVFAYGRDEIDGKPLLVKYKVDMSGISEENKPKPVNNLELTVLNNPSKAPVIMVNGLGEIIVYNLLGQKVGSYEIKGGKTRINGLKTGVYFAVYGDNILKIEVIK